jgi:hypothetical protein
MWNECTNTNSQLDIQEKIQSSLAEAAKHMWPMSPALSSTENIPSQWDVL